MKSHAIVLALPLLLGLGATPARAQTMDEMRVELKQLRAEVEALKGRKVVEVKAPAEAGAPDSRVALRVAAAASAPKSAIPGGMLVPGTSTSLYLYGYGETHAIHDFRQTSSPDVFTDLTYQPLNNAGGQTGKTQFTAETSRLGFRSSRIRRRHGAGEADVLKNGVSAEIVVVGNEGLVGISLFMGGGMHLLFRYTQALITQMSQTAAAIGTIRSTRNFVVGCCSAWTVCRATNL